RAASPLSGLRLQAVQRWKLALRLDDPLHGLDAKGPDQLVLEVGDADVEAEALQAGAVQVAAEAGAVEGSPEVGLLALVAEAAQDDLGPLPAQREDEAADRVRAADGPDLDASIREAQAAPPCERLQRDLVALPLDDDDRARPRGRFHWAGTVAVPLRPSRPPYAASAPAQPRLGLRRSVGSLLIPRFRFDSLREHHCRV